MAADTVLMLLLEGSEVEWHLNYPKVKNTAFVEVQGVCIVKYQRSFIYFFLYKLLSIFCLKKYFKLLCIILYERFYYKIQIIGKLLKLEWVNLPVSVFFFLLYCNPTFSSFAYSTSTYGNHKP